jgi:hypothetical protein
MKDWDMQSPIQAVKERPILFSGAMVRAILEGRKTQTRRIIKPQPDFLQFYNWKGRTIYDGEARQWCWMGMVLENIWDFIANRQPMIERCPYGQPGDRLWVRETWGRDYVQQCCGYGSPIVEVDGSVSGQECCGNPQQLEAMAYRADGGDVPAEGKWRPSIHMPRRASRILLEIVSVRVERLQDISHSDAVAEGVETSDKPGYTWSVPYSDGRFHTTTAPKAFAWLCGDINGDESWDANPWVWVVEFKRVTA